MIVWWFDVYLFHNGALYHIETSPLICIANQWADFYIIVPPPWELKVANTDFTEVISWRFCGSRGYKLIFTALYKFKFINGNTKIIWWMLRWHQNDMNWLISSGLVVNFVLRIVYWWNLNHSSRDCQRLLLLWEKMGWSYFHFTSQYFKKKVKKPSLGTS